MQCGGQMTKDHIADDPSTIIVVFSRILHEAESIHIAHVRTPVGPIMNSRSHSLIFITLIIDHLISSGEFTEAGRIRRPSD